MPTKFPTVYLPPAKGLNLKDDKYRLEAGDLQTATNIYVNNDGSFQRCDGYTNLITSLGSSYCLSLFERERWDGVLQYYFVYDTALKSIDLVSYAVSDVKTSLSSSKRMGYVAYNDYLYFGNSFDVNYVQNVGGTVNKWGIVAPTGACTGTAVTGTALATGAYKYVYTEYNSTDVVESPPSPAFTVTTTIGNRAVNLTGIGAVADTQSDKHRIYRTTVGGALYYRVTELAAAVTSYSDTTADSALGTTLPTENYTTIPLTNIFLLYSDRVYMAGNLTDPFRLYYSEPYMPHFYNAVTNYFDFDVTITALAKLPNGIVVFERNKLWYLTGTSPSNFSKIQVSNQIGCTNPEGVCYIDTDVVFISDYGVYFFDGSTLKNLSDKIDKGLLAKNLDSAVVRYDKYNKRLYVIVASA
jgi:hypothetical protein